MRVYAESRADRVGAGRAGSVCDYFVNNACQPRAHATTLYTKMPDTLLGTGLVSIWPHKTQEGLYVAELYTRTHVHSLHVEPTSPLDYLCVEARRTVYSGTSERSR